MEVTAAPASVDAVATVATVAAASAEVSEDSAEVSVVITDLSVDSVASVVAQENGEQLDVMLIASASTVISDCEIRFRIML